MPKVRHFLNPIFDASRIWHLAGAESGAVVATRLGTAFDSATRRSGLLGRPPLAPGEALILAPCSAVHTFGMSYPIDVLFVARDGRIRRVAHDVSPRRVRFALGAFAAVELQGGRCRMLGLTQGHTLRLVEAPEIATKVPSTDP